MTIETTWVRVLFGSPGRMLATAVTLFVLILAAPIVLALVGLWVVGVLVCLVGLACVVAIVLAMLPGRHHRR
ncbi:MAG TPA: hypothetical protein VHF24_00320 [Acidimicrobiales bacterium]|nr:hypothetical protein [Acidimicrobiales bacterium]